MAGRSVKQLEALATLDVRPYLGTVKDWSPNNFAPVWGASSPAFRRFNGQINGLAYTAAANVVSYANVPINADVAIEFLTWLYGPETPGVPGNLGRIFEHPTGGNKYIATYDTGGTVSFECYLGANFNDPLNNPTVVWRQKPIYMIYTRTGGTTYRYVDGSLMNSGNAGASTGISTLYLGNRAGLNNALNGLLFLFRLFDTHLSADEAARLYEHSRVQLWPGAPKRSGIVSRMV